MNSGVHISLILFQNHCSLGVEKYKYARHIIYPLAPTYLGCQRSSRSPAARSVPNEKETSGTWVAPIQRACKQSLLRNQL